MVSATGQSITVCRWLVDHILIDNWVSVINWINQSVSVISWIWHSVSVMSLNFSWQSSWSTMVTCLKFSQAFSQTLMRQVLSTLSSPVFPSFIRRHKIIVVFVVVGPLNNKWFSFPEIPDEFLKENSKSFWEKTVILYREKEIDASKVFWIIKEI